MSVTKHPIVSIVIPCCNYGHFLSETLESVLAQTWQQWECIIVDDGSSDDTAQVAALFQSRDPRIKYIYQRNQGVSAARNTGIDASIGSYIQLLDADDKLETKKLEMQLAYLEQHPSVDIVYGDVRYFQENNLILRADISKRRAFAKISAIGNEALAFLVRRNIMVINAPLIRTSVFKNVGIFNQNLVGNEDWEYWIRCGLAGRHFHYLEGENTCAMVRAHRNSATQNISAMLITGLAVRENLLALQLPAVLHKENNYRISLQLAKLSKYEMAGGNWALGCRHAASAVWKARWDARIFGILFFLLTPLSLSTRLASAADRLRHLLQAVIKP